MIVGFYGSPMLTNFLYPSLIYIHFDCIRPIKAKCGKTEKLGDLLYMFFMHAFNALAKYLCKVVFLVIFLACINRVFLAKCIISIGNCCGSYTWQHDVWKKKQGKLYWEHMKEENEIYIFICSEEKSYVYIYIYVLAF